MNKKLSTKISIISFLLLLGVVIGHSVNIDYNIESGDNTIWLIENFISNKLVKVIIPIFFFISAYLFFLNFDINQKFDIQIFKNKIIKRLNTLGKPYLFWCLFWFIFLYIIQILPFFKSYFGLPLYKMSLWLQFWNLFIEPVNYPFWFIRELLFVVLITPILYLLVKYLKYYILIFFFVISLFYLSIINIFDIDIYRYHMLFYYCLGIYCAVNKVNLLIKFTLFIEILLVVTYFSLCALIIYFELNYDLNFWYFNLFSNITTLIGCIAVWSLYDYLDEKFNFNYHEIFSFGFIIYAIHGIPILMLKDAFVAFFNPTKIELILFYFFSFSFIIVLCLVIGKILKKFFPKFYYFSTGGR